MFLGFFFSKHCKNKADESFADHNSYMCGSFDVNVLDYSSCHSLKVRCFTICFFPYILHYQDRRYMAEILPIWRKTIFIQSINQSLDPFEDLWHLTLKLKSITRKINISFVIKLNSINECKRF